MSNSRNLSPKKSFLLVSITLLLFTVSCKKENDPAPVKTDEIIDNDLGVSNETVNEWVTENMRAYYYWNESIPTNNRLNFNLEPGKFFETILSPEDRFSWIEKTDQLSQQLSGVSTTTGMKVSLITYNCASKCLILGIVRYVIPNSPADKAGVKRGTLFTKVNGTELTPNNYQSVFGNLYNSGKGFQITVATLYDNIISDSHTLNLPAAQVQEPSVYLSKVLTTSTGKKVGYIFYNTFLNSKTEELFNAFNELKQAGVEELILDLRYNLGGGVAAAGVLAGLIKQDYNKDQIFVNYNYNKLINAEFDKDNESRDESFYSLFSGIRNIGTTITTPENVNTQVKAANLNLSKVYILGTGNSASASELVIHNLAPYINVIHIGETTIGKNEGSITIQDERKPRIIDWAIQPIIVKLADKNGNGDYDKGLIPDEEVDEFEVLPFLPLGNQGDPLIAKALSLIDPAQGRFAIAKSQTTTLQQESFSQLKEFNEKQINPRPVQLDGTINKEILKKLKEDLQ